jgi:hypothetical protein
LIVSCVYEAEIGKETEEGAQDYGGYWSVSLIGSAKSLSNKSITIELRDSEEGAAGDVEAGVSTDRIISRQCNLARGPASPCSIGREQEAAVKECWKDLD